MATFVHFRRYGKRRKGWHTIVMPRDKNKPSEMLDFVQTRPGLYALRSFDEKVSVRSPNGYTYAKMIQHVQFYFTHPHTAFEFKMRFG